MENHHFSWENPLLMAIFNSYVKLPEGSSSWLKNTMFWVTNLRLVGGSRTRKAWGIQDTGRNRFEDLLEKW